MFPDITFALARIHYDSLLEEAARERRGSAIRALNAPRNRGARATLASAWARVFASRVRPTLRLASS